MTASVTPRYLLEGATYALEQCGLLLRDAALLYENEAYASALALSALAREQLGQRKLLLELRKRVVGGQSVTLQEVQTRCANHLTKQEAGVLSTTMIADQDSGLGQLLSTSMRSTPGSAEWKAAREQLAELDRRVKSRLPGDRHKQRMAALYVDAVPGGWKRPIKQISREDAIRSLQDAINDYGLQYQQDYTDIAIYRKEDDPELCAALMEWTDRPQLPPPTPPPR